MRKYSACASPGSRTPVLAAAARAALFSVALVTGIVDVARAEHPEISSRRSAERTNFTDGEIREGFFKIAFGAELQVGPRTERIRKFDSPVRVYVNNLGTPDRRDDVARIVADIRSLVAHLDMDLTNDRKVANVFVTLVRKRDFKRAIRVAFGIERARQIQETLSPQCLSGFARDEHFRIQRAEVILPVDAGEFTFYDCAYEELLQALGPINDDRSVPWTMFNDDVQMGFFDVYDQYLLNILYDPRVRPGMTKDEVDALLPDVLPMVRARVSRATSASGAALPRRRQ